MSRQRPWRTVLRRAWTKLALRFSTHTYVDGIWVGAMPTQDGVTGEAVIARVKGALSILARYDPHRSARIRRDIKYIWVTSDPWGLAHYQSDLRLCHLYERFVTDPIVTLSDIAATIAHEATHARLTQAGIPYASALRARIERTCTNAELAFADRLPEGLKVTAPTDPAALTDDSRWSDKEMRKRYLESRVRGLREVGASPLLIRVFQWLFRSRAA